MLKGVLNLASSGVNGLHRSQLTVPRTSFMLPKYNAGRFIILSDHIITFGKHDGLIWSVYVIPARTDLVTLLGSSSRKHPTTLQSHYQFASQ